MNKDFKFLVVDDFSSMRKIIKNTLSELGCEKVYEAENGLEAWDLIEKATLNNEPFDFIISDWNMPQMSGLELLKKFRSEKINKHIPFIMVTAESEQRQILDAIKAGCSDYIVKPFSPDIVKEKIIRAYDKCKASSKVA
jgi:two-component system chemotaxis response regulator CheY